MEITEIDGSCGEGGGQIARSSVGLSAYTGKPVHLFKIRANRPKPGLSVQHLEGIRAVASMCSAKLKGDSLGSETLDFIPGKICNNSVSVKIGTAGSTGLIFQSLQLPACHCASDSSIRIDGGATFGKYAPPLLYTKHVLLPTLEKMGFHAEIEIERHGFFPVGGAKVSITVHPTKGFKPLVLDRPGKVKVIKGFSIATKSLQKAKVAERQESAFRKHLTLGVPIKIETVYTEADCPGSGLVAWAETDNGCILGADGLGEKGKPAQEVGKEAADKLLKTIQSGATVDERLADQILLFMALAKGQSRILTPRFTCHCNSNMFVIQKFLPAKFNVEKISDSLFMISVSG